MRYFVQLKGNEAKDMGKLLKPIETSLRDRYAIGMKGTFDFAIYKNPTRIFKGEEHTCRNPMLYGLASRFAAWMENSRCDLILLTKIPGVGYRIIKPPHNLVEDELSLSWDMGQIGTGPYVDKEPLTIDIVNEDKEQEALELIVEEYLLEDVWLPLYDAWPHIEKKNNTKREFIINLAQMIAVMHRKEYAYNDIFSTHLHYNIKTEEVKLVDFGITTEDQNVWGDRYNDVKKLLDQLKLRQFSQPFQKLFLNEYCEFAARGRKEERTMGQAFASRFRTNTCLERRKGQLVEVSLRKK